ncbi:hypothetical protein FIBSPDRAFT_897706 [Athelia psychrophila]|uniref:Uncharacterized protein n=1 Tax=Athelia psychrophila TaxID=1759441 RepID=A0A166BY30_9AGAM|nr:hypothetical protein FIBSPDRAFT_897706 [Fibularhizoctonia sp. CBS 109695]
MCGRGHVRLASNKEGTYSPPRNASDSDRWSASSEYSDIQETAVYQEGACVPTTDRNNLGVAQRRTRRLCQGPVPAISPSSDPIQAFTSSPGGPVPAEAVEPVAAFASFGAPSLLVVHSPNLSTRCGIYKHQRTTSGTGHRHSMMILTRVARDTRHHRWRPAGVACQAAGRGEEAETSATACSSLFGNGRLTRGG